MTRPDTTTNTIPPLTPEQVADSRFRLILEGFHPSSKSVRVHDQLLALMAAHEVNTDEAVQSIEDLQAECERLRDALEFYRDADYSGTGFWDGIRVPGILQDRGQNARVALERTTESEVK
jgi:hypothetical protein